MEGQREGGREGGRERERFPKSCTTHSLFINERVDLCDGDPLPGLAVMDENPPLGGSLAKLSVPFQVSDREEFV